MSKKIRVSAKELLEIVKEVQSEEGTAADVASLANERYGSNMTAQTVSTRLSHYRTKHGIQVPKFTRGNTGPKLDVEELSSIFS